MCDFKLLQPGRRSDSNRWSERSADHRTEASNSSAPWRLCRSKLKLCVISVNFVSLWLPKETVTTEAQSTLRMHRERQAVNQARFCNQELPEQLVPKRRFPGNVFQRFSEFTVRFSLHSNVSHRDHAAQIATFTDHGNTPHR